jgi:hypothetical protein
VFSTRSPGFSVIFLATAPTDSSTALLPIRASQLCRGPSAAAPAGEPCLSSTNPRFTYSAVGFDLLTDGVDPMAGAAKFNAYNSSISQGGFVTVAPGQTGTTPITINPAEWALTPAKGVLAVVLDNQSGKDEASLHEVKLG